MKGIRAKFKTILLAPLTVLFLLFGFSLQGVHAQSITMQHGLGDINLHISCSSPCGNAPVVLKDEQKAPVKDRDDEPEPPEQTPYIANIQRFAEPQKPANNYLLSRLVVTPPDLVKLYANFRF